MFKPYLDCKTAEGSKDKITPCFLMYPLFIDENGDTYRTPYLHSSQKPVAPYHRTR